MEIEITKIVVLINESSTDEISLYTNLPSGFPNWLSEPIKLNLKVQHGTGIEYALKNFKYDIEVIDAKNRKRYLVKYGE